MYHILNRKARSVIQQSKGLLDSDENIHFKHFPILIESIFDCILESTRCDIVTKLQAFGFEDDTEPQVFSK